MKKLFITVGLAMTYFATSAQLSFTGSDLTENFNSFTATGANGGLDANTWIFNGFSSTDDLMRGAADPPETQGGVYSLSVPGTTGDNAIYFQGTGSDFTPGSVTLVITNDAVGPMENINVAYDILEYNDGNKSNSFNLQYSTDGTVFTEVDIYTTVEAVQKVIEIATTPKNIALSGVTVPVGEDLYLRWFSDDVSGRGSIDEIGLDNVVVSATAVALVPTMGQWALFIFALMMSSVALGFIYNLKVTEV